jgi:hypothetical protein
MNKKKVYISINGQTIRQNARLNEDKPPIRVAVGKSGKPWYASDVEISGPSRLTYSPDKPAPWGARLWLEVDDEKDVSTWL